MNKKVSVAFVAVLTLAVLATAMVGAVQAKQTKEPYYVEYGVGPIAPNTVDKNVGVCRIRSGSVMQGAYDGPVGVGTFKSKSVWLAAYLHGIFATPNILAAYFYNPSDPVYSFVLGIYGLPVLGVLMLIFLKSKEWKKTKHIT